jgi:exodeoxyribonuclease VII large subunit
VRLDAAVRARLARLHGELGDVASRLDALSPLAVLGRGYAIASGPSGAAVLDAGELAPGDVVRVRVHRGAFSARVLDREREDGDGDPRAQEAAGTAREPDS